MAYPVTCNLFEGSLALLVELAKLRLLDVFIIKLQGLTEQYLADVRSGQSTLDELADPLPLLGQLTALKARLLLPQPPVPEEDEEGPVSLEELARRLREYEQFKSVAQVLSELHALQHEHFGRAAADRAGWLAGQEETPEGRADLAQPAMREIGITGLMEAFGQVLDKAAAPMYEVETEPWTVEMKVEELTVLLAVKREIPFTEVFTSKKSKLELVVLFLALLELVRRHACRAVQAREFGDILIVRREATT